MIDSSVENGEIEFLSGKARIIIPGVRNAQSDTVSQLCPVALITIWLLSAVT